jgi:hypothetical protein
VREISVNLSLDHRPGARTVSELQTGFSSDPAGGRPRSNDVFWVQATGEPTVREPSPRRGGVAITAKSPGPRNQKRWLHHLSVHDALLQVAGCYRRAAPARYLASLTLRTQLYLARRTIFQVAQRHLGAVHRRSRHP